SGGRGFEGLSYYHGMVNRAYVDVSDSEAIYRWIGIYKDSHESCVTLHSTQCVFELYIYLWEIRTSSLRIVWSGNWHPDYQDFNISCLVVDRVEITQIRTISPKHPSFNEGQKTYMEAIIKNRYSIQHAIRHGSRSFF